MKFDNDDAFRLSSKYTESSNDEQLGDAAYFVKFIEPYTDIMSG